MKLTRQEAEAQGLTVDDKVYPWVGYAGPRFDPTYVVDVLTDDEAELLSVLESAASHLDYCGYGDKYERDCAKQQKLPETIEAVLAKHGRDE